MTNDYAFVKNGLVMNIAVFDNPTSELLEQFKNENNADKIVEITDETKSAYVNGEFKDGMFYPPKPTDNAEWDNENWNWIVPLRPEQLEALGL